MRRHSVLAGAFALALAGARAAAGQVLVEPPADLAAAIPVAAAAAAQPSRFATLRGESISESEVVLAWTAVPESVVLALDLRSGAEAWRSLGELRQGSTSVIVAALQPGRTYFFRLRRRGASAPGTNEVAATTWFLAPPGCNEAEALCLLDGRYRVQATFDNGRELHGRARPVGLTNESGYLWFFAPGNIELVAKVLDGCAANGRHWVFLSGLTSLRVVTVVVDTETGATTTYLNEQGQPFAAVQDTGAFASCG